MESDHMKVLLVGSGAREHAMAESLSKGAVLYSYIDTPNQGIIGLSKKYALNSKIESHDVVRYANKNSIDLAVIGPETYLANGLVDVLEKNGIMCASPNQECARIEWSKAFTRNCMRENGIAGNPDFMVVRAENDFSQLERFLKDHNYAVAVKPDYLTGGKGVRVYSEHRAKQEIHAYVRELLKKGSVVIEEKLMAKDGLLNAEFSLQAFVANGHISYMPVVQDFKRAYNNNKGPNTGSMGSYSLPDGSLPFLLESDMNSAKHIMRKTVSVLESYRGTLYGQFMLTTKGVTLIEYNARFGDPEAINVLPRMKTNLANISLDMVFGTLPKIEFDTQANVCVYLTPEGYPTHPVENAPIRVDMSAIAREKGRCYIASVNKKNNQLVTTRSRALALLGSAKTIANAKNRAYELVKHVSGSFHYRTDIAGEAYVHA